MSLASFLGIMFLILTIILLFKRKTTGNLFILFGGLTFLFVILYGYFPKIPEGLQSIMLFTIFSLMILLFGLFFGISLKLFKFSDKVARIGAVFGAFLIIVFMFNMRYYLNYLYIPVLLYMIQDKINKKWLSSLIVNPKKI